MTNFHTIPAAQLPAERMYIKRKICIEQTWINRHSGTEASVRQVHRKDGTASMVGADGAKFSLTFVELKRSWRLGYNARSEIQVSDGQ